MNKCCGLRSAATNAERPTDEEGCRYEAACEKAADKEKEKVKILAGHRQRKTTTEYDGDEAVDLAEDMDETTTATRPWTWLRTWTRREKSRKEEKKKKKKRKVEFCGIFYFGGIQRQSV